MPVVSAMTFLQPLFGKSAFLGCQITVIQCGSNRHVKGVQWLGTVKEEVFRKGPGCLSLLTGSDLLWLGGLTCMSKACKIKSSVGHSAGLRTAVIQVVVCHLKRKIAAKLLKLNML